MKTTHVLTLLACLVFIYPTEAQFLKKLKKKAQEAAERTILNRADKEVAKKTDQALDSLMNPNSKRDTIIGTTNNEEYDPSGVLDMITKVSQSAGQGVPNNAPTNTALGEPAPSPPDNNVQLPDSYIFSYTTKIEITNAKGTNETEYYLQPNETYYAQKQINPDFKEIKVYDADRNIEVYFAEIKGEKRRARQKMDLFTKAKMIGAYKDAPAKEIKDLGNKKILGYDCSGYEIISEVDTLQLWITNDAPATLFGNYFALRADEPGFGKNTMIMAANYVSATNAEENYQLKCISIEPFDLAFTLNEYNP